MKKILISIVVFSSLIIAQPEDSTLTQGWNPFGVVGLNLSQVAFENWTQGGANSLSYVAYSNIGLAYIQAPYKWKNFLKVAYGRTKLEGEDYRTTDNEIYFESVLSRSFGWKVDPFFSVTVRTAITDGYDYKTTPATQIVGFFDPGYVSEALGFIYEPSGIFSTRLGVALQQTFADSFAFMYSDDPETPNEIEKFKLETGLESVTTAKYSFMKNMSYSTFLRLFTRFDAMDVWDVRWDNVITAKINDYINVNFMVVLVHEISQTRKTQYKQALQIGIVYSLF